MPPWTNFGEPNPADVLPSPLRRKPASIEERLQRYIDALQRRRRRDARVQCTAEIQVVPLAAGSTRPDWSRAIPALTQDLSQTGVCFQSPLRLEQGQRLLIAFPMPAQPAVYVMAEVKQVHQDGAIYTVGAEILGPGESPESLGFSPEPA